MPIDMRAGNDCARLAAELAAELARPDHEDSHADGGGPAAVLARQVVLVPGLGMRDWLRQQLALAEGVCAGIDLPLPQRFLGVELPRLLGMERPEPAWDPARARWAVLGMLDAVPELAAHLPGGTAGSPERAWRLAGAVVDCFDRYALYRPAETLAAWGRSEDGPLDDYAPWQSALWQGLQEHPAIGDPVAAHAELLATLREPCAALPGSVHVFGFNNLAPRLLDALTAIAERRRVVAWALQPCRGWWGDQVPLRTALRQERTPSDWGNRLLGDWGRIGREFLLALDETGADYTADPEDFHDPGGDSLLHRLQGDLLAGQAAGSASFELAAGDRSLQVHACHSQRRELEVVKRVLAERFSADPHLAPHEVAVMSPDPERYADLAAAVFAGSGDGPALAADTTDRPGRSTNPCAEVLLRLLRLLPGRWGAGEALALLELEAVARAWGADGNRLQRVHELCDRADIRWGVDAAHRAACSGRAYHAGSWRQGLTRLHLAWLHGPDAEAARPRSRGGDPAESVLPVPGLEPGDREDLELLTAFFGPLLDAAEVWRTPRPAAEWAAEIEALLHHLLPDRADDDPDLVAVLAALGTMAADATAIKPEGVLPPEIPAAHLEEVFAAPTGGPGRGAITVCGLEPMRSIPFRVICLIGMEDGAFPRRSLRQDFDLVARDRHRPGDRDRREEDRYLLLETLISARDHLCITYCGHDAQTGEQLPPSTLVGELLAQVAATCGADGAKLVQRAPEGPLHVAHRLHACHDPLPEADGRPVWPGPLLRAEAAALADGEPASIWHAAPLPAPTAPLTIDCDELVAFWRDPAAAWLRRLGIRIPEEREEAREDERFTAPTGLDRYLLGRRLLAAEVLNEGFADRLAAEGALPPGALLGPAWSVTAERFAALRDRVRRLPAPMELEVRLDGHPLIHLRGRLPAVDPELGPVLVHPGDRDERHEVAAWVLALLSAAAGGPAAAAVLAVGSYGRGCAEFALADPEDPAAALTALLDGYAAGLTRPLPFAPAESKALARDLEAGSGPAEALAAAAEAWSGPTEERFGGAGIPATAALVWGPDGNPFTDPAAVDWAAAVWTPLQAAAAGGARG